MREKHLPMRMCILTRESLPKKELFRIVRTPSGEVVIDDTYKLNGRGCYLKKDIDVINKAKNKKSLNYHLSAIVDDKIYDELLNIIRSGKENE